MITILMVLLVTWCQIARHIRWTDAEIAQLGIRATKLTADDVLAATVLQSLSRKTRLMTTMTKLRNMTLRILEMRRLCDGTFL